MKRIQSGSHGKRCRMEFGEVQAQVSHSPLPVLGSQTYWIPPATHSDTRCGMFLNWGHRLDTQYPCFLMGAGHPGSLYCTETCRHSNLGFQSLVNDNYGKPTGLIFFSKGKVCQYFSNFSNFSPSLPLSLSLLPSLLSSIPLSFLPPLLPSFSFLNWTLKLL